MQNLLNFIAEAGTLKRVRRSGWDMLGIPDSESVAEHSFRCAVIGYVLAKMEKADTGKVVLMCLFNDIHEARIGDPHKVAHRYLNVREAESAAFGELIKDLDGEIKFDLGSHRKEYDAQDTPESVISRDADLLECLIQAKEYSARGFVSARKFFKKAPAHLKTKSAKKLWESTAEWDPDAWWEKLARFER
jgi:putative hydrolases of HD superfamily